jgi:carboxyl-terminal processing protease
MPILFKSKIPVLIKTLFKLLVITSVLGSCKKEGVNSLLPVPVDSIQTINKWVLDSMMQYYYYNSSINSSLSLNDNTDSYFKKLINPGDRFSWISNGKNIPAPKSSFEQYGFHFILVQNQYFSATNLLGVFTLVGRESAAERAGIERGFYFSKVNGQVITPGNMEAVTSILVSGKSITLTLVNNATGNVWTEAATLTLAPVNFEDRPVYTTRVFEKNGIKTGYIFYKSFNEFFDLDLFTAFDKLKAKNVTELIVDLRYNPGGSVSSAAKLCALISKVNSTDAFGIFKGNANLGTVTQSFNNAISLSSNTAGKNFAEITGKRLAIKRVYILTTNTTASAAELVINNLKPYLPVIQIGEKTFGKDEAGLFIKDLRQPQKVAWYMQPTVYKLFNASNKGGYVAGILPDIADNEYETLPLQILSSPDDRLIKQALINIYGDNKVLTETLRPVIIQQNIPTEKIWFNSIKNSGDENKPLLMKLY